MSYKKIRTNIKTPGLVLPNVLSNILGYHPLFDQTINYTIIQQEEQCNTTDTTNNKIMQVIMFILDNGDVMILQHITSPTSSENVVIVKQEI